MWICQTEPLVDEELAGRHAQRLVISCSKRRPSGILRVLYWDCFFAPWTAWLRANLPLKLICVEQSTRWRDVTQRDLDTLGRWVCANLMKFSEVQGPTPVLGKSQGQNLTGWGMNR